MFDGAFELMESLPMVSVVAQEPRQLTVRIESGKIRKATRNHMFQYFNQHVSLAERAYFPYPLLSSRINNIQGLNLLESIVDSTNVLSEIYRVLIKDLAHNMMAAQDYQDGYRIINDFEYKVLNSSDMPHAIKIELLELLAGSYALIRFFETGGYQLVNKNLADRLEINHPVERTAGCQVDWRGAWMDGVIGLTLGAASGFYAGATGGTIVMPIVGTVTGAVNGAVIGGAIGFTSGVLQGIASDLFLSCSRNTNPRLVQSFASCELAWEAYYHNKTNQIPPDCFEVRFTF